MSRAAGKTAFKSPAEGGLASRYAQLLPTTTTLGKADSQPAKAKPVAEDMTYTEQQTSEAHTRYQHYLTAGIDSKHVTPFQEDWAVNAVSMLPHHERYLPLAAALCVLQCLCLCMQAYITT